MPLPSLFPLLLAQPAAFAGTVVFETTVATEVRWEQLRLLQTFGPATVAVPDLPEGTLNFQVYRDGVPVPIEARIPAEGRVRVLIGAKDVSTDSAPPPPPDGAAPRVQLQAAPGDHFAVVMDGKRLGGLDADHPMLLEALSVGAHQLEVRSPDLTLIWSRGTLELQPGDELVIRANEGRTFEVYGRAGALRASD